MKISDILDPNVEALMGQKKVQKSLTDAKNNNINNNQTTTPTDSVNISKKAKILSTLSDLEANHQKKLEMVQSSYENGHYEPNLSDLAKSILKDIKNA